MKRVMEDKKSTWENERHTHTHTHTLTQIETKAYLFSKNNYFQSLQFYNRLHFLLKLCNQIEGTVLHITI